MKISEFEKSLCHHLRVCETSCSCHHWYCIDLLASRIFSQSGTNAICDRVSSGSIACEIFAHGPQLTKYRDFSISSRNPTSFTTPEDHLVCTGLLQPTDKMANTASSQPAPEAGSRLDGMAHSEVHYFNRQVSSCCGIYPSTDSSAHLRTPS